MRAESFYLSMTIGFGYVSIVAGMFLRKQKTMPVLGGVTIAVGVGYLVVGAFLLLSSYSSLRHFG
jgi:hypothetical protein